jgi:hypothetical protein
MFLMLQLRMQSRPKQDVIEHIYSRDVGTAKNIIIAKTVTTQDQTSD